jgi:hypothetical protein
MHKPSLYNAKILANKPVPPRFRYAKLGEHGPLGKPSGWIPFVSGGLRPMDERPLICFVDGLRPTDLLC